MKLGLFLVLYSDLVLESALDRAVESGLSFVEIGTGNYPGSSHCDAAALLRDTRALDRFRSAIGSRGLSISALSCQGNPLHPDEGVASSNHEVFRHTVALASSLGVGTINVFSGCPGDPGGGCYPNWVTCAWPAEYRDLLDWQWTQKVIPYWREQGSFAADNGVRLAFEMHPGFVVYNPETLLRLRAEVGPVIGANLDPSHFFWQGIDVPSAITALGREQAIYHFHAKDTEINTAVARVNGVLDTAALDDVARRSWIFRTVGWGHGESVWREIVTALRRVGYDGVLSIEHEDALLSVEEGLRQALAFLRGIVPEQPPVGSPWWT